MSVILTFDMGPQMARLNILVRVAAYSTVTVILADDYTGI